MSDCLSAASSVARRCGRTMWLTIDDRVRHIACRLSYMIRGNCVGVRVEQSTSTGAPAAPRPQRTNVANFLFNASRPVLLAR